MRPIIFIILFSAPVPAFKGWPERIELTFHQYWQSEEGRRVLILYILMGPNRSSNKCKGTYFSLIKPIWVGDSRTGKILYFEDNGRNLPFCFAISAL
jgi:hypothetical protein